MSRYVLGEEAVLDLEAIWEFIAQDKPVAADRWIDQLFDAFELIANTPGIGHKRQDLTQHPILFWPVEAYLILYRTAMDGVEINSRGARLKDIPKLLSHRK